MDLQQDDSQGNPVLSYLQHHGTPQGLTTPLANGYTLNAPNVSTTFNAPLTNEPYSKISGDFNLIHVNPYYFSGFASLPTTITHGMLLFTTQFAQITLIVAEKAAFEDMHVKGFVQKDCAFAGHPPGRFEMQSNIGVMSNVPAVCRWSRLCAGPKVFRAFRCDDSMSSIGEVPGCQ